MIATERNDEELTARVPWQVSARHGAIRALAVSLLALGFGLPLAAGERQEDPASPLTAAREREARALAGRYLEEVFGADPPTLEVYRRWAGFHADGEYAFENAECNRRWGYPYFRRGGRLHVEGRCRDYKDRREASPGAEPSLFLAALRDWARLDPEDVEIESLASRRSGVYVHLRSRSSPRVFRVRICLDDQNPDLQGRATLLEADGASVWDEVGPEIEITDGYTVAEIRRNVESLLAVLFGAGEPTLTDYRRIGRDDRGPERDQEMAHCARSWPPATPHARYLQNYGFDSPCRGWLAARRADPSAAPSLSLRALRRRFPIALGDLAAWEVRVVEGPASVAGARLTIEALSPAGDRLTFHHPAHPLDANDRLTATLAKVEGAWAWAEINPWESHPEAVGYRLRAPEDH